MYSKQLFKAKLQGNEGLYGVVDMPVPEGCEIELML
jgi:hypothetical protein